MAKASDVILVHGAWTDGSSWSKVIPLLVQADLRPTAVQLPLTSLQDDVATVKRAIALAAGPIVLVGHSYGGVVITEAGNDPKVISLVHIAAFAPEAGESAGSLGTSVEAAPLAAEVRPDAQGFLKLTEAGMREAFAQDLDESEKSILTAVQAPTAAAALGGAVSAVAWHRSGQIKLASAYLTHRSIQVIFSVSWAHQRSERRRQSRPMGGYPDLKASAS